MRQPSRLSIGLLTYSTKPRGSVVHTLALAEFPDIAGEECRLRGWPRWTTARGLATRRRLLRRPAGGRKSP